MGYQLPGLGNVAFPGFGALGKQQTRDTRHAKKGKDQTRPASSSSQSPSSSSASASVAARPSCEGRLLEKGFLQRWRLELRPLLNSLQFVEASNKESCSEGTSCIGPFQISRHYHHDAWKQAPPIAWSRCRDLNHAENTVIAYWFKYCPDALEKHDFETLAKIHKGGPQGLQKEEINYYWRKVSQHLKEQETAGSKKENTAWVFFSNENHVKQEGSSKMHQKSSSVLSPINTNTMDLSKARKPNHIKSPASCVARPKQQLPLMQTLKPKMFRRALPAKEKKSAASFFSGVVKSNSRHSLEDTDCSSTNKRLRQTSYFHSNTRFEHGSLGHAFNMDFCHMSQADRMEKAAINVQAIWRMRCVRGKYVRMRSAAVLIQKKWRKHHFLVLCKQRIYLRETQELNSATNFRLEASSTPTGVEKQGGNERPIGSPCELLYRTDISPNQEDELLSELVSLLNLDMQTPIEACHSFRFPRSSEENSEACTPKMKTEMRLHFAGSSTPSAEREAQEPSYGALSYVENTNLLIKQALLSPLMEKEIIAELVKLFPPCKIKCLDNVSSASNSLVSTEGVSAELSRSMENEPNVLHEQSEKDGIIRRLKFNSAGEKENSGNDEIAIVIDVGCSEGCGEACNPQWSLLSSSEDICRGTSSSSFSSKAEGDDEELKHIDIPLLVDQSPVLTSKRRVRSQNPCNRKVEKALVSSLSEWRYSVSFEEESQDQEALREGLKSDLTVDSPSSFNHKEVSTSKESILCSPAKSSQQARLTDISPDAYDSTAVQVSDNYHPDFLLETSDVKTSTVYAKAIFRCLNFSLDEYEDGGAICEKSQTESRKMDSRISTLSQTRLASLQHLFMLWDIHNVDLLTRSLKFKALQAANCEYQQEHLAADEVADIRTEIASLENLPTKLKEESKKKELVLHQRDVIYTNIAAYCNAQERQALYDKWEIQKLLNGRLKKIVYELLWVDPQRYQESAELVIQYL